MAGGSKPSAPTIIMSKLEKHPLDDDGKLREKFRYKKHNSKQRNISYELTFEEYANLLKEAGLKSSDIGHATYHLARYEDEGPYRVGNCRFITAKENLAEQKTSDLKKESDTINRAKAHEKFRTSPDAVSDMLRNREEGDSWKAYKADIETEKEKKRLLYEERRLSLPFDPNSPMRGSIKITDGTTTKTWTLKMGAIPEGWFWKIPQRIRFEAWKYDPRVESPPRAIRTKRKPKSDLT